MQISNPFTIIDKNGIARATVDNHPVLQELLDEPAAKRLKFDDMSSPQPKAVAATTTTDNANILLQSPQPVTPQLSRDVSTPSSNSSAGSDTSKPNRRVRRRSPATPKSAPIVLDDEDDTVAAVTSEDERHYVLLGTGLDATQKKKLKKFAEKQQATIVDQFSSQVTHVITPIDKAGLARRTLKYAMGVVCGCWLISFDCTYQLIVMQL